MEAAKRKIKGGRPELGVPELAQGRVGRVGEGAHGKEFFSWEVYEYPKYERGTLWFTAMIAVGLGLLIYALITANFLFALIIIMFALVLYLSVVAEPAKLKVVISEDGLEVGVNFIPYREIKSFWFVYDPPAVKNLYLDFKGAFRPRMSLDIDEQNPNQLRDVLKRFIAEDVTQEDEPFSDTVGRWLKI